jgi:hypothetical protein
MEVTTRHQRRRGESWSAPTDFTSAIPPLLRFSAWHLLNPPFAIHRRSLGHVFLVTIGRSNAMSRKLACPAPGAAGAIALIRANLFLVLRDLARKCLMNPRSWPHVLI